MLIDIHLLFFFWFELEGNLFIHEFYSYETILIIGNRYDEINLCNNYLSIIGCICKIVFKFLSKGKFEKWGIEFYLFYICTTNF